MLKEKTCVVNNKRTGLVGFESVVLMPGANEVSEEVVKRMKDHPVVKKMVEDGILEFCHTITEDVGLSKHPPFEAISLVEATVDVNLLNSWAKIDKRKPVLSAIQKQLGRIAETVVLRDGTKN